jgi:hypothetical protein
MCVEMFGEGYAPNEDALYNKDKLPDLVSTMKRKLDGKLTSLKAHACVVLIRFVSDEYDCYDLDKVRKDMLALVRLMAENSLFSEELHSVFGELYDFSTNVLRLTSTSQESCTDLKHADVSLLSLAALEKVCREVSDKFSELEQSEVVFWRVRERLRLMGKTMKRQQPAQLDTVGSPQDRRDHIAYIRHAMDRLCTSVR